MNKGSILIIDDEERLRHLLARIVGLEGYHILEASNAKAGLKLLEREEIQLVISDVKLPDANGVDLTATIKSLYPYIEIIVLTAFGTIQDGVRAIKNGAFDYITKGDDNEKIIPLVSKAMDKALLQYKVVLLERKIFKQYSFKNIIGHSKALQQAIELAKKVSSTNTTVLLTGETGTGKEVFAQAIHYEGSRKNKNFVAINCSTIGKDLLESELFGHKSGAFTGAVKDKKGLFEEANEGTIFLDEIGEMNIDLQAKLLRVIETGSFIKVGETKETKVNVRIIAATNRDLQKESETGNFRLDLFYRLSVFQIKLPSLQERKEDIQRLAEHFSEYFAEKVNKRIRGFHPDFLNALKQHPWKGNIRELKNIIERAVILAEDDQLSFESLPYDFDTSHISDAVFSLEEVEKVHIRKVLNYTKGNKTEAARLLNIGLTTLYRKIEEYKL
ncbi:MAG TPA: sigma-54 dependent transcriptional regulator [Cytophagaceae bacterium]|jgi:two-component system NtrC family response regulator|nr:sigma-54 dependent transcriptional regulator [Cytophagaceae bacterium]